MIHDAKYYLSSLFYVEEYYGRSKEVRLIYNVSSCFSSLVTDNSFIVRRLERETMLYLCIFVYICCFYIVSTVCTLAVFISFKRN